MGRVGRSGGGWGGVEEGREEWGKECLASHRPQHLWLFLPLSNRASISLTLLHVSPIFLWRIIRIFTFPLPPLFQPSFSSHFSPCPLLSYCPLQPLLSLGSHSFPILLRELTNSKLLKHALIIL